MLHELVYSSIAVPFDTPQATLDDILASSRRNNLRLDITGVLLFENGGFVQLLEGSRQSVTALYYDIIAQDPRHTQLKVRWEAPLERRNFPNWQMGYARIADLPPGTSGLDGYLTKGIENLDFSSQASIGRRLLLSIYQSMAAG